MSKTKKLTVTEQTKSLSGQNDIKWAGEALTHYCHNCALEAGWWSGGKARNVPTLLMLCVSELAEAMEGDRKDLMDDKLPERKMLEVELADTVIRIFDMAGGLDLDVAGAIAEKMKFNATREDHKLENRAKEGGKNY